MTKPDVTLKLSDKAANIYEAVRDLPIVSPHGHCDPAWFAENTAFRDPAELLIIPDHYVFRMLYSQGVPLASLGVGVPVKDRDPRAIFQLFAAHWHLFLGTPSHLWLAHTLAHSFGVSDRLTPDNAMAIYDIIDDALQRDAFQPRALFDSFDIAVLATTDGALDDLAYHSTIAQSDWKGRVVPTFRPDAVLNPSAPNYVRDVARLGEITNCDTANFLGYLAALGQRRAYFKDHGATATDHDVPIIWTEWLDLETAKAMFKKALAGQLGAEQRTRLYGHMLIEMAQMSVEDGLVMQIHAGSARSTNLSVLDEFGTDKGADIPRRADWVAGLNGMLNRVGNSPDLTLIAFTLDETGYAREMAPMAGHWPALRLGPPWWFHDSANGIARYLDQVVETAGYWNLAGFNDDTRAFLSIPARHDLWRRGVSLHLAQQCDRGVMNSADAAHIARLLSHDLALSTYRLGEA
jgi:glucuronate isomerase